MDLDFDSEDAPK